jgi:hypothetical protein
LGFKTPNEVFMQSLNRVALRVWIYVFNISSIELKVKNEIRNFGVLFEKNFSW